MNCSEIKMVLSGRISATHTLDNVGDLSKGSLLCHLLLDGKKGRLIYPRLCWRNKYS